MAWPVGVSPLTIQQSLQALVDEWPVYWGTVAPQALPAQAAGGGAHGAKTPRGLEPERHRLHWPGDFGEPPDWPSVAELRK
eukprot:6531977-Pyramimonas_sp.AAC.1